MTVKRSLAIRGHQTSISIEDEFWTEFQRIAQRRGIALAALVAQIDAGRRTDVNLSSAVRLFVLADLRARLGDGDQPPAPGAS